VQLGQSENMSDATLMLAAIERGDPLAAEHTLNLLYFAGLTNEEVARIPGISVSTTKNYWTFARAWLFPEIESK
jgi:DNA-directed RNA polymerase specialized sigma24 family protein